MRSFEHIGFQCGILADRWNAFTAHLINGRFKEALTYLGNDTAQAIGLEDSSSFIELAAAVLEEEINYSLHHGTLTSETAHQLLTEVKRVADSFDHRDRLPRDHPLVLVVKSIREHVTVVEALAARDVSIENRNTLDHLAALHVSCIFRLLLARMKVHSDVIKVTSAWIELGMAIAPLPETSHQHQRCSSVLQNLWLPGHGPFEASARLERALELVDERRKKLAAPHDVAPVPTPARLRTAGHLRQISKKLHTEARSAAMVLWWRQVHSLAERWNREPMAGLWTDDEDDVLGRLVVRSHALPLDDKGQYLVGKLRQRHELKAEEIREAIARCVH